ncbi:MAG: DUF1800 domain-containing protein [Xanthomonadaceae bacterium]|nr:DUF1800 domain-containing protein [Xanthomonadaceae bacterium]
MPHAHVRLACIAALIAAAGGARADSRPSHSDLQWLDRITYGVNSASLAQLQQLGRQDFLEAQLAARDERLPPDVQAQIDAMPISHQSIVDDIATLAAARDKLKSIDDTQAKVEERKVLRRQGILLAVQTQERELLRAVYSPAQLKEQMVWFWLNHFSVFDRKGPEAWLDADYVESAIRPNALGNFRDLVMATLTHPAMLVYLDNARNAAKHHNENYARELMELHTLGVNAGYTQNDVQEMVRILTGTGVALNPREPRLRPDLRALYIRHDGFEFNPARHDFGDKVLLGHSIRGSGFDEVRQAVDLLVAQPACAHFISGELATYFVSDNPPAALVDAMAETFQRTHGDIRAVLRTLFDSPQFTASLGHKFKDPMHYLVSSLRLAYDGDAVPDPRRLVVWLNQQGEGEFGHATPDGYPLVSNAWNSSGQMSARFELARAIGNGDVRLFDGVAMPQVPRLAGPLFARAIKPWLSPATLTALNQARSPLEWNTYLLAAPESNYR